MFFRFVHAFSRMLSINKMGGGFAQKHGCRFAGKAPSLADGVLPTPEPKKPTN